MKNVILSIVVLAVLVAGGIGGTLADFSDIEVSENNTFATGALDLVVSNNLGQEYNGDIIPRILMVTDALPCCDKSVFFDLHNYGQGFQGFPTVYLHVKNLNCGWVMPKKAYAWLDAAGNKVNPPAQIPTEGTLGTGFPKPVTEPEYVAEKGGIVGELANGTVVTVPGTLFGLGENCTLARHIGVIGIQVAGPYDHDAAPMTSAAVPSADWTSVNMTAYDLDPQDGVIKLNELVCKQISLGNLPYCKKIWVHLSMHLQDFDEEDAFAQGLIPATYFDETIPAEAKWDHWPTNAYQKDFVEFDMSFELFQDPK